jgi:hypothetical protein
MKIFSVLLFLFSILLLNNCNKKDDITDSTGGTAAERNYTGSANTTIRYYEYNAVTGQDEFVEEKNYQYAVKIFTKPPLSAGSINETNPINIQIYPDRSVSTDEEGHLDISSASLFTVNNTNDLLLQYWVINLSGNNINGTLTNTHTAEAAAANLIWAWDDVAGIHMVMPFPVGINTTMQGTITDTDFQVTVQGESVNTYRKFTATISAVRN